MASAFKSAYRYASHGTMGRVFVSLSMSTLCPENDFEQCEKVSRHLCIFIYFVFNLQMENDIPFNITTENL